MSVAESSSCINGCVTCLYQFPDPAKVSDPAEDYIMSLHQHFLIYPIACVSKLHLKEIFAKTTLAASVANTLFELCSDVIKGWQNLLQAVHLWRWSSVQHPGQSHPVTLSTVDSGCFGCCCSSCAFFSSTIFCAVDLLTPVSAAVLSHTRFSDSYIPDFFSYMQNM